MYQRVDGFISYPIAMLIEQIRTRWKYLSEPQLQTPEGLSHFELVNQSKYQNIPTINSLF